jgi:nucleoside-diphosphate-sugar epimerase
VRFFNIYGLNQPTGFVIPDITNNILNASGHTVQLKGSEDDTRDFLYVNDLAEALIKVIERKPIGETINLAGGSPVKISDLAKMISKIIGRNTSFECAHTENIKISRLYADISKAKKLLGWQPRTELSKGLEEVIGAIMEARK